MTMAEMQPLVRMVEGLSTCAILTMRLTSLLEAYRMQPCRHTR